MIDLSLSKGGEKMVMTIIIPPLIYSHPSIKDTLPQRSVIASQSQLCLDNPSSKCTKCLTMPRTPRDCPQHTVWREQAFSDGCVFTSVFNFSSFPSLQKSLFHLRLTLIPNLTHTSKASLLETGPERRKLRD